MLIKTLIVHDTEGTVQRVTTGNYTVPVGIPYIEADVPEGQYPIRVDITKNPPQAVLSDPPVDQKAIDIAKLQQQMAQQQIMNIMLLKAMAETYESVLPFLPDQE